MRWRVGLLVAGGLLGLGILIGRLVSAKQLRQIPVAIVAEGATLNGSLHVPHGKTSAVPVVVLLHGSGPDGRSNPYYQRLAEQFGQVGFATFIYDKRGTGESGGQLMSVPFQTIIDDAVKVVAALRQRPEVMGEFIVVWGGSEGGSIAPEVAVRGRARAVITQSASGVPFWKQNQYQNVVALKRAGSSQSQIAREILTHRAAMHFARTAQDWDKFEALRASGSNLPIHNGRDDQWWRWYGTKLDYSPSQWLGRLKVPILAMWGGEDQLVPITESTNVFSKALAGNPRATLKTFIGADHGMSVQGEMVHLGTMKDWLMQLTPKN